MRVISAALALQLVSLSKRRAKREEEKERREDRVEAQRILLEWRRARCALFVFMCRVESERRESRGVVRIFPMHAVALARIDENRKQIKCSNDYLPRFTRFCLYLQRMSWLILLPFSSQLPFTIILRNSVRLFPYFSTLLLFYFR